MQVWIDIWDANYSQKLGNRLRPIMASYKRKLDEAGMGRATFVSEPRSLGIIQSRRIAEVWLSDTKLEYHQPSGSWRKTPYKRMMGAFVIEEITPTPKNKTISISGPGTMSKLINKITLPGLAYENQSVSTVLSSLAALAGWTVDADAALNSQYISVRFAGENVFRAIAVVAETQGVHIRESSTYQQIEAGAFGEIGGFAEYMKGDAGEASLRKDSPMIIESADIREISTDVVNKIYVYGGGDGDAALTMALSDRSFVDSESANGRSHYFIANAASIALYGEIARRLDIKRISSVEPSDAAEAYAANAIADGGKAWLDRNATPYEMLKLSVQNVNTTVQPGDKVHVRYQDVINLMGVPYQERNIDEPYWVMAVEESISAGQSLRVALEVANLDRYEANASDIVVGMVDSINVQNVNIQPYPAPYYWSAPAAPIDTATPYSVQFVVSQQAIRLHQALAYVFRRRWTAVSGIAEASGAHRHRVFRTAGTLINPIDGYTGRVMEARKADLSFHAIILVNASNDDVYTEQEAAAHTHDFSFTAVQQDDAANLLEDATVSIDGVGVASGLFPDGSTDDYEVVDITAALRAGTLRGFHEIEVSCGAGRGDVYVIIFIDIDVSRVRSS